MRYLILALVAALTIGCGSCATVAESAPAPTQTTTTPQLTGLDLLALLEPPVQLDVDFDPSTPKKVGRVRFDVGVSEASARELIAWIEAAQEEGLDALVIDINTPGGSVMAGQRIGKAIEESRVPVYCISDGMAASMGFYIMQSCEHRLMTKRTMLMAHGPSMMTQGNVDNLKNDAKMLQVMAAAMAEHECSRMKISTKECMANFEGSKEWWMGWEEALKVGAIDGIATSVKDVVELLRQGKDIP